MVPTQATPTGNSIGGEGWSVRHIRLFNVFNGRVLSDSFDVTEVGISDLRQALDDGRVTSVQLVQAYLRRIDAYDGDGPCLNSVVVLDDQALAEAASSDRRRSRGELRGPLDGIPYTAKDSYLAAG